MSYDLSSLLYVICLSRYDTHAYQSIHLKDGLISLSPQPWSRHGPPTALAERAARRLRAAAAAFGGFGVEVHGRRPTLPRGLGARRQREALRGAPEGGKRKDHGLREWNRSHRSMFRSPTTSYMYYILIYI